MKSVILTFVLLFISSLLRNTDCISPIRIQSFGRTVPLGTLYNARTLSFIPNSSVFSPGFQIPSSAVTSTLSSGSHLHVHPLDSTDSKFKFNHAYVSRADIISILSEQLKVQGSWRFLIDEPKGQSVCYKTELRRKWKREIDTQLVRVEGDFPHVHWDGVAMPHSVVHQFSAEELLSPNNFNATHFVAGISYGKTITAIYEDHLTMRKFGLAAKVASKLRISAGLERQESQSQSQSLKTDNHLVRLYTDRPLHPAAMVDLPEELEQHFMRFSYDNESETVPLLYELIPLSSVVTFLEVNDTVKNELARRWSPEYYVGDPYIDPLRMDRIYREFDSISIVQFRMREATAYLHQLDGGVGGLVKSLRWSYIEKLNSLQWRFETSLERFKSNLRDILTWFRNGKYYIMSGTFAEAVDRTLITYQGDEFSVKNVTRRLDTEFPGLPKPICLEQLDYTLGNLVGGEI